MRIAYLTQSYPPMISGASIAAEQLAQGMSENGHQVLVIAASDKKRSYRSEEGNLTLLRLRSIHNPMRVGQRFLLYPRLTVMKALKTFKPDIIHTHEPVLCWIGFEYAKSRDIPTTLTLHMLPWMAAGVIQEGTTQKMAEYTAWKYLELLSHQVTSIIATTKAASAVVERELGIHTEIIPCGVDTKALHPRRSSDPVSAARTRLGLPSNVPLLLHVGRLDPEKNVDYILQAMTSVFQKTNAHLLIVGDGREKSTLIDLCRSLGIANRVHFAGYISMKDGLPEIYRMADLFVMASEVESQGLVLLEAATSGLPLVAFNTPAIAEIVHHQVNGYLVQSGDISGLGSAIVNIIRDSKMAGIMGRESHKLSKDYDRRRVQYLHEQFYQRLIEQQQCQDKARPQRKVSSKSRLKLVNNRQA